MASKCKNEGYSVAIETCGYFCLDPVLEFVDLIDYVLFDLKIIDNEKHKKYCGQCNTKIHENFKELIDKTKVIPRVPIIPGINDTAMDIALLCKFLSQYKDKVDMVHILPYHNLGVGKYEALDKLYTLAKVKPPSKKRMKEIKEILEHNGFRVTIGG